MSRLLLIIISCLPLAAAAQFGTPCIDSNRVNPYYQCNDPDFNPVCGCNNVTYRNGCEMTNVAGVNYPSANDNGVCQNDFFFIFTSPNPVRNILRFDMQFADQQSGNGTFQVFNNQGNIVYSELLNSVTSFPFRKDYDFTQLETGMYIIVVQAKGVYRTRKFLKREH